MSSYRLNNADPCDRALSEAIEYGVERGYLSRLHSYSLRGRSYNHISSESSSCWICFSVGGGGGGGNNAEGLVVMAIVLFAFSFFIALGFTINSIQEAVTARDAFKGVKGMEKEEDHVSAQYPSSKGEYEFPTSGFNNNYALSGHPMGQLPLNQNASQEAKFPAYAVVTLLQGKLNERIYSAVAQGTMALALGLLTSALLVVLVVEPQILTLALGISGAGLFVCSAVALGIRSCINPNESRERECAQDIQMYLSALSKGHNKY